METKDQITIEDIEAAIDEATEKIRLHKGDKLSLMLTVINPLQAKLQAGIRAGLNCSEKRMKARFALLEKALQRFS